MHEDLESFHLLNEKTFTDFFQLSRVNKFRMIFQEIIWNSVEIIGIHKKICHSWQLGKFSLEYRLPKFFTFVFIVSNINHKTSTKL